MDSADYGRIHGDLVHLEKGFFDLASTWRGRPDTPGCLSPSAIAWQSRSEDIARQLGAVSELLTSARARAYRAWREALREETTRRAVGDVR